ncbi:MAG: hypothetical protein C0483_25295 [Pirellula sp.]|nr:hypothetical protein [Pirellula sp.]
MNGKRILSLIEAVRQTDDGPLRGPATVDEINQYQERTGIRLPPDVQEWLMISNGPIAGPCLFCGISDSLHTFDKEYEVCPKWRERGWIPILNDGCGNFWVVASQGEFGAGYPVVFINSVEDDDVPCYLAASSLGHFLEFVLEDEILLAEGNRQHDRYWPFEREKVLAKDPEVLKFHGVPLPWEA